MFNVYMSLCLSVFRATIRLDDQNICDHFRNMIKSGRTKEFPQYLFVFHLQFVNSNSYFECQ